MFLLQMFTVRFLALGNILDQVLVVVTHKQFFIKYFHFYFYISSVQRFIVHWVAPGQFGLSRSDKAFDRVELLNNLALSPVLLGRLKNNRSFATSILLYEPSPQTQGSMGQLKDRVPCLSSF